MWNGVTWLGVFAFIGLAISMLMLMREANGGKPPEMRLFTFVVSVLLALLAVEKFLEALPQADVSGVLLVYAHRAVCIWAILTVLCAIPYVKWEIGIWRRYR